MNVLLAVLLCFSSAAVLADEYFPGGPHGTTVCIEIRPSPHANPTKVCGPVVHGGPQSASRPLQKSADPMVFNLPSPAQHHSSESDESREAGAPCATNNGQKSMMPFPMRQAQPIPPQAPPQQPQPQPMMQRMDMTPEGMLPMMAMEFEGQGWRQAGPPCAQNQRQAMPPPMGYPMMAHPPMNRPPMGMMHNSRTWMVNPQQAMGMRGAEEPPAMAMGMRSADEKPQGGAAPKKESLENLLKECEEKTKLLQEKEAKITELKTHMANKKEEEMMKKE